MDDDISHKHAHKSEAQVSEGVGEFAPKVHFKLWSALGYQYCAQATPLVVGTYLSLAIGLGVRRVLLVLRLCWNLPTHLLSGCVRDGFGDTTFLR